MMLQPKQAGTRQKGWRKMAKKKLLGRGKALDSVKRLVYSGGVVKTEEIKRRRERLGLTMAEAAKLAGWKTQQAWSGVERGTRPDPQVSTVIRVASVLRCRVDDLVCKTKYAHPNAHPR